MIYADFNGSAPLCNDVLEYLQTRISTGPYANPNSIHSLGKKMMFGLEKCRRSIAKNLGCESSQIIFNSGASEGISQIFHSLLGDGPKNNKKIVVTSAIEHAAVYKCLQHYGDNGFEIKTIDTLENGVIDLEQLLTFLEENYQNIAVVTVMASNNETGVLQPYHEIGEASQKFNIPFFSDTTQLIGKTQFNFQDSHMDFSVLSSHKVGALIGSGLIIAKDPTLLKPLVFGGGQEKCMRGGTQNYMGIETMAIALDSFTKAIPGLEEVNNLRVRFEKNLKEIFPNLVIIGEHSPRLATTTMVAYPGIHGQAVQIELESNDIFITTSSACSDNSPETSRILKSMGITDDIGRGVVRISLCLNANQELYDKIELALTNAYNKLKKIHNY